MTFPEITNAQVAATIRFVKAAERLARTPEHAPLNLLRATGQSPHPTAEQHRKQQQAHAQAAVECTEALRSLFVAFNIPR